MQGLRKSEGEKFERFFALVQEQARKRGCVYFADCGEGNEFDNGFMEGENLSGWLIPDNLVKEFEQVFMKPDFPDEWDDYVCWALWENESDPIIRLE